MSSTIVIGQATQVSFSSACVISAQWGFQPNPQRLYCLDGTWEPWKTYYRPVSSLSITCYASSGVTYDTAPSRDCSPLDVISASVTPATCDATVDGVSGSWLVASYSYSKPEKKFPGQESWSLTRWETSWAGLSDVVGPTYILRGISEGQSTNETVTGIQFQSGSTFTAQTGSVAANSIGNAEEVTYGIVEQVGGGASAAGDIGQGNASMPYTPLYI